jgi:AcrR family transcriptional regulator
MYALYLINRDEAMLAAHLGISIGALLDYLQGKQEVPIAVVRQAIRVVLEKTRADNATRREVLRKIRDFPAD